MKRNKKYIIFLLLFFSVIIIQGCNRPAPTQLVPEGPIFDEHVEVEVISNDPTFESKLGGVDTTGLSEDILQHTNIISVSGIKFTYQSTTAYSSLGQAIFFDRSQPVLAPNGRIIGFRTITPGIITFDGHIAAKLPFQSRFRRGDILGDTLLGFYYAALGRRLILGNFEYPYGSNVNFNLEILGNNLASFQIPTPPEIQTQLQIIGKKSSNNLAVRLKWDRFNDAKFEIIISGKKRDDNKNIALYRLRTRDDGLIIIPPMLINSIPPDRFDGLILTLIRKYTGTQTSDNGELFISSQSIHSIQIDFN